jgi:hypothetical protein
LIARVFSSFSVESRKTSQPEGKEKEGTLSPRPLVENISRESGCFDFFLFLLFFFVADGENDEHFALFVPSQGGKIEGKYARASKQAIKN